MASSDCVFCKFYQKVKKLLEELGFVSLEKIVLCYLGRANLFWVEEEIDVCIRASCDCEPSQSSQFQIQRTIEQHKTEMHVMIDECRTQFFNKTRAIQYLTNLSPLTDIMMKVTKHVCEFSDGISAKEDPQWNKKELPYILHRVKWTRNMPVCCECLSAVKYEGYSSTKSTKRGIINTWLFHS